jgi:acetylornithine deacetylase/succinyl-diaminopimelate desuccinylase-like protein
MKNFLWPSIRPFVLALVLLFCLNADAVTGSMRTQDPNALNPKKILDTIQNHETAILKEYAEFLSLPDVASDNENIRRNAEFLLSMLSKRGIGARLLEAKDSPPVIYGELAAPRARRTILFYAHYDGQPANPSQWKTNPWKAILMDNPLGEGGTEVPLDSAQGKKNDEWRLYARSASDDKAPIITLLAALDILKASNIPLSVNVKFIFEGEEEAGSPHLGSILEKHKDSFRADGMLLCDGPVHQTRRMQIFFGARGTIDLEITVPIPRL